MSHSLRLLQQDAFVAGALAYAKADGVDIGPYFDVYWMEKAEAAYPPRTEQRPRELEVTFKGLEGGPPVFYRVVNGQYEVDFEGEKWVPANSIRVKDGNIIIEPDAFYPETIADLVELFNNPTETVELED